MNTTDTITEHIIAEYLPGTPIEDLDPSYDLLDNGVVDSLALLGLIAWVEQRYQIPIDQVDISPEDFRSVDAIGRFIEKQRDTLGRGTKDDHQA